MPSFMPNWPPRLHFLLHRVFNSLTTWQARREYCFMNSVASKDTKKDSKHLNVEQAFNLWIHHYFITQQIELQIYQFFLPVHKPHHKPQTIFNSTHRLLLLSCHIKNRSVDFTKQAKALPSSVHSSRRSPELHFPEWWSGGCYETWNLQNNQRLKKQCILFCLLASPLNWLPLLIWWGRGNLVTGGLLDSRS